MRIAVISDVHGNSAALDAVLSDIERRGISQVVNLGDALSGPLDPAGTAERLMAKAFPTIAGNHDRWLYDPPNGTFPLWEEWTLPHLSDAMMEWVRALPGTLVLGEVLLSHGTPTRDNENWLHRRDGLTDFRPSYQWEVEATAEGHDHPVILCGHTHLARMLRLPDGRLLVNPGSVGVPAYVDTRHSPVLVAESGAPDARYAVVEKTAAGWQASLCMVPYDPSAMIAKARSNGAEVWVDALRTGWVREAP